MPTPDLPPGFQPLNGDAPPLPPGFQPMTGQEGTSGLPGGGGQELRQSTTPVTPLDTSWAGSRPNWESATASMAVNPQDELRIYSQLSGIPLNRWGRINGNVVYSDESGRVHRAVAPVSEATGPGDALLRIGQWAGSGFGPALPQAAGAAAAVPFGGPVAQGAAATAAGGATDFIRQQIVNALLGRSPTNVDLGNVAGQAGLAGGSALAGNTLGWLGDRLAGGNRFRITGMTDRAALTDPNNLTAWRLLAQNASDLNIPLRPDQITNLSSMRQTARQLMREPGSTDQMTAFQARQQGQAIPSALASEIPGMTPGPGGGAGAFTQGAADTMQQARQAAVQAASPHYQAAVGDVVPPGSMTANYRPSAASFDQGSPIAQVINGYADRIEGAQNAAQLDGIYREIRDAASTAAAQGNNTLAHHLGNLRDTLNAQLTGAPGVPPLSPNIAAGRAAYAGAIGPYNDMSRGLTGMAADLAARGTPVVQQREGVASILGRGNADEISAARTAFENAGNLDAWNAGVRDYLAGAADTAGRIRMEGAVPGNVAGRFLQEVAPTIQGREAVTQMLGGTGTPEADRMARLAQVLQAGSRTVAEGSPTVTDLVGRNRFIGGPTNLATRAGSVLSPSTWIDMLRESSIARNAPRIAQEYTPSNAQAAMAAIENPGVMSPNQLLAARLSGRIAPEAIAQWLRAQQLSRLPNQYPGAAAPSAPAPQ